MQANGLDSGENQIKLLQKVGELTLYLIEKDKEINTQQEEIDCLKQHTASNTDRQETAALKAEVEKLIS